jgi:hypothetical protein
LQANANKGAWKHKFFARASASSPKPIRPTAEQKENVFLQTKQAITIAVRCVRVGIRVTQAFADRVVPMDKYCATALASYQ